MGKTETDDPDIVGHSDDDGHAPRITGGVAFSYPSASS